MTTLPEPLDDMRQSAQNPQQDSTNRWRESEASSGNNRPYEFLPKVEGGPWDNVIKGVKKYDDEAASDWNSDVDTVLIFAGLFSAAVTAFVVESYKWLSEDPNDKMVRLLSQLSQQDQIPFSVTPRSKRINILWFLSLIFALSAASAGIIVKQWLREYRRDAAMDNKQTFKLRQLRYQGWDAWKVPEIIASLPILLEIALFLFFIGVVDLLWSLNPIVAAFATATIGITFFFLIATTFGPAVYVFCLLFNCQPEYGKKTRNKAVPWHDLSFVAWKSPQSLMVFQLAYQTLGSALRLPRSLEISSWVKLEWWILWKADNSQGLSGPEIHTYFLRGMRWTIQNLGGNLTMTKNIVHCLLNEPTKEHRGLPLVQYATEIHEDSRDLSIFRFLGSRFDSDHEMFILRVELALRCIEDGYDRDGISQAISHLSFLRNPEALPDAIAAWIPMAAIKSIQSDKMRPDHLHGWLKIVSRLLLHSKPGLQESINEVLNVITRRIQEINFDMSKRWLQISIAWWLYNQSHTEVPVWSDTFRDFVLWAEEAWKSLGLGESISLLVWVDGSQPVDTTFTWSEIKEHIINKANLPSDFFSVETTSRTSKFLWPPVAES
ncbi:hypothetical protein C8J56DRAFT_916218 [Mycena floridula]|nr:hypothetical protein C8J56DRAFT_916218 [Mycena floridula]